MNTRFGVFVPQGWAMDLTAFKSGPAKWQAMRRVAKEAEVLGYDGLWLYDHFHTVPTPEVEAVFECWSATAALAVETSRIRIGQMVTCNSYRPPALLAKMASTIDVISNGRLDFGLGGGWYEHEYRAYGYPFPPVGERLRQLDEAIQVITAMWSQDHATFKGRYYQLDGAIDEPKPVQRPHPPIWIGGAGEKVTLRIVAQRGDASNFGGALDLVRHKCAVLEQHCRDVGRDYDQIVKSVSFEPIIVRRTEKEAQMVAERARAGWDDDQWDAAALVGTPEQCIQRLRAYERLGISYFVLYFQDIAANLDPLHLFAEEVLPAFR